MKDLGHSTSTDKFIISFDELLHNNMDFSIDLARVVYGGRCPTQRDQDKSV